jgi:SAM-dependent methyltransferase
MKCVDLGCGGGDVTFELARLVAPGSSVTGLDMDQVKLDLAGAAAVERGISNVEFTAGYVSEWHPVQAGRARLERFITAADPGDVPALNSWRRSRTLHDILGEAGPGWEKS